MTKNSKVSIRLVKPKKKFIKVIVFCIGATHLIGLPVESQSRSLEWERSYIIYNDDMPGKGYKRARCVMDLDFSGQRYEFNCFGYGQFKATNQYINFFPDPSKNPSGVTDVVFTLNEDLSPIALGLRTDEGVLVGKGKLICKEISKSGLVGTSCGANVILRDGRKVKLAATVLMKL